jgi:hypothetical protein
MTLYNVHIYRELRLYFPAIKAETPDDAAQIAADKLTADAEYTEDCDGENLAALVDLVGDDEFEHSVTIDFDHERMRKAASDLLEAIPALIGLVHRLLPAHAQSDSTLDNLPEVIQARAALARVTAIHQPTIERTLP